MQVIAAANELVTEGRKVCVAIGVFDGVHLGHQQIIRQTLADARQHESIGLVLTFDRHPNSVVAPDKVPPQIYSLSQKLRAIQSLGADAVLLVHFDKAFSQQPGEAFIRKLAKDLGRLQSLCVGADFTFGCKRSGNVELLRKLGAELKFTVHGMAAVALDGRPVSSTRIREVIDAGDLDSASQMLGRTYSLAGTVVRGDCMGRELGFPTANIDPTGLVLPPRGVYAVRALAAGKTYRAVLNIGYRPTLQNPKPELRVEAHLLGFSGGLYGEELEVTFVEKLREEKKFASLRQLKLQISRDIRMAIEKF
jgi:riboflavin kinase/FMN adenylyltransferase